MDDLSDRGLITMESKDAGESNDMGNTSQEATGGHDKFVQLNCRLRGWCLKGKFERPDL